jgi:hypothetical protein
MPSFEPLLLGSYPNHLRCLMTNEGHFDFSGALEAPLTGANQNLAAWGSRDLVRSTGFLCGKRFMV